jgi:hypothetical protein
MLALGAYLLSAVASLTPTLPTHGEPPASSPLASTYEQAACDPSDSGECAQELELAFEALDLPPAPAVLDCSDTRMLDFGGWCDLPRPASPLAPRPPTLHNGNHGAGFRAGHAATTPPLNSPPPRPDDSRTLPALHATFLLPPTSVPLVLRYVSHHVNAPSVRLERPPRA